MNATKAILIVGGSGFIGTHLATRLRDSYKVFMTYYNHRIVMPGVSLIPMSISNRNWVKRVIFTVKPDVVIYVAGNGDLRQAELEPQVSELVYSTGASTASNAADLIQSRFIYLSNSYVFDGVKGNYHETDVVLPATSLGKFKVGMENFLKGKSLNQLILRSSPVYGRGNGRTLSFLDRVRIALSRGERIELSTSELQSFAPVDGLIDLIVRVVESGIKSKILHYGGLTKVTPYDFAKAFADRFGFDSSLISPRSRGHESQVADFSLNSSLVAQNLKIKPLLLEEGFDLFDQGLVSRTGTF